MIQQSLFGTVIESVDTDEAVGSRATGGDTPLSEAVFTVIDLETTGLSAKKNAITEITGIQFRNGEEIGKYTTLVKPTEAIPSEVEGLTGITNDMVQQAPALVIALSELCRFTGSNPIIVGHNAPFDIGFLREKLGAAGLSAFVERFDYHKSFCTRVLAVKAFPGLRSYEGVVVATHCGVYNPNPHRAESDVRMSAGILFKIIAALKSRNPDLRNVQDLLDYQGVLEPRGEGKGKTA